MRFLGQDSRNSGYFFDFPAFLGGDFFGDAGVSVSGERKYHRPPMRTMETRTRKRVKSFWGRSGST